MKKVLFRFRRLALEVLCALESGRLPLRLAAFLLAVLVLFVTGFIGGYLLLPVQYSPVVLVILPMIMYVGFELTGLVLGGLVEPEPLFAEASVHPGA